MLRSKSTPKDILAPSPEVQDVAVSLYVFGVRCRKVKCKGGTSYQHRLGEWDRQGTSELRCILRGVSGEDPIWIAFPRLGPCEALSWYLTSMDSLRRLWGSHVLGQNRLSQACEGHGPRGGLRSERGRSIRIDTWGQLGSKLDMLEIARPMPESLGGRIGMKLAQSATDDQERHGESLSALLSTAFRLWAIATRFSIAFTVKIGERLLL